MTMQLSIIDSLNAIISNTRLLNNLLLEDRHHFANGDISVLEHNNVKKESINTQLRDIIQGLGTQTILLSYQGNLLERLTLYASSTTPQEQPNLLQLLSILKEEASEGYQLMLVNRNIVNANLLHFKSIFQCFTNGRKKDEQSTYNHSGSLTEC